MSRPFVDSAPVDIADPEGSGDIITIRPKMDVGTQIKVRVALEGKNGNAESIAALLEHNILGWRGPGFDGVPCDLTHILMLDPNGAHFNAVLEAITERNKPKASPNPKSAGASTSASAGASVSVKPNQAHQPSATSTPRSPLQSALDGHLNRSGD